MKPLLNGVVADAGQFFEVVQPSTAVSAMVSIMECLTRQARRHTVTIRRSRKVQGFLGGNPFVKSAKTRTFTFHDLLCCFAACMYIPFCKLGDTVIRMSGLPIGGLLSRIAASVVLAWEEHQWVEAWPGNFGLDSSVPAWNKSVVARRYIDDTILISKLLRYDCLVALTHNLYTVTFDALPNSRKLSWLDMVLNLDGLELNIKRSNFEFPPLGMQVSLFCAPSCGGN